MPMEIQNYCQSRTETIMAALSTLTPHQFSRLTHSLTSHFDLHHRRRLSLLLSPSHFSFTLHSLLSLSFNQKALLISRFHLSTFKHLTHTFDSTTATSPLLPLRDVDAALLLLLLCHLHHHHPQALNTSTGNWRTVLLNYYVFSHMFTVSGLGSSTSTGVVSTYIDEVTRFLDAVGCGGGRGGGGGGKAEREVAAAAKVVVSLPSVVVVVGVGSSGLQCCVICREEMREGREVCRLPCEHLFHWGCVLPWLKERNTCPCCRLRLPTDDVLGEIERLWGVIVKKSGWNIC